VTIEKGWIKLYRKLCENPIWTAEKFSRGQAWVDLLLNANHADGYFMVRGNRVDIKRGQIGWSEVKMAARWKWSRTKVRNFLKLLEKEQQIKQQKIPVTSIITILNYEAYQGEEQLKEQQSGQQKNSRRTAEEQQKNINKKNKNDKKNKNNPPIVPPVKKSFAEFVTMTEDEYEKLLTKYGKEKTVKMIEILDNYKGASGKKYKSDYRAILNWVVKRVEQEEQQERKGGYVSGKRRLSRQDDRDWEKMLGID